jgi:two-component system, chemotaxis family, protein-glutamate methylesterase/glutaminase
MAAHASPEQARSAVAIAASAGGIAALKRIIQGLPADFPAAVLVEQHLDPTAHSRLAHILQRHAAVAVVEATEGAMLEPGHVYVAPPAHHLVLSAGNRLHLTDTPPRNYVRPSADELFESVAAHFEGHAIAVVLSGTGSDGSAGSRSVESQGGLVVVQDPESSEFPGMPRAAIRTVAVTKVVHLDDIATTLMQLLATEHRV